MQAVRACYPHPCSAPHSSVVKPIAHLHIDLPRQVPVKSAVGEAVVVLNAVVGYVQRGKRRGEAFSEVLA